MEYKTSRQSAKRVISSAMEMKQKECESDLSDPEHQNEIFGSWPNDHYFRSVCWFVCLCLCLFVCLFVCAEFFSAVFDPISIKLGHMSGSSCVL